MRAFSSFSRAAASRLSLTHFSWSVNQEVISSRISRVVKGVMLYPSSSSGFSSILVVSVTSLTDPIASEYRVTVTSALRPSGRLNSKPSVVLLKFMIWGLNIFTNINVTDIWAFVKG